MTGHDGNDDRVWLVERDGHAHARLTRPSFIDRFSEAWRVEPLVETESERALVFSKDFWHDHKTTFREPRTGVIVKDAFAVDATPTRASPLLAIRGLSASRARRTLPAWATAIGSILGLLLLSFHWTVAGSFGHMYQEFGATATLPLITLAALGLSLPLGLGLVVLGLAAAGAHPTHGRRAATIASIALGIAGLVVLVGGLYQPIFQLAGMVQQGD